MDDERTMEDILKEAEEAKRILHEELLRCGKHSRT